MKTLLQTLFLFLLVTQICFAQWQLQNPLITQNSLNDVILIDENTGWAVGDYGTILKTTNGGVDWLAQESGTTHSLQGVCFADANNGWVVGDSGTVVKTTNGGWDWVLQSSGITSALNDVDFVSETIGTAVGNDGKILRTTDAGTTWNLQTSNTSISLLSVCFVNSDSGWAVGGGALRTTNGGMDWFPFSIDAESFGVYFLDSNNGWVVGQWYNINHWEGIITKTTNGGMTWSYQTINNGENLVDVCFTDLSDGWAVTGRGQGSGQGEVLHTTDGGTTWISQISGTRKGINSVSFINSNKGVFVGENGTIKYTGNGGVAWICPPGGSTNNWSDAYFSNSNNGLVIGDAGTILRTTTGGTSWTPVFTGIIYDFTGMYFINENEGWAVTGGNFVDLWGSSRPLPDSCKILHTTDGGATWTTQITKYLTLLFDVDFIDAENGWAVGFSSTDSVLWYPGYANILRTTDGGITWNQQLIDSMPPITNVEFVDLNTGWIISTWSGMASNSEIYKTTDGGNTWSLQFVTNGWRYSDLNDIVFLDLMNGIAVGNLSIHLGLSKALIIRTTDGGTNWTQILLDYPRLKSIFFTSETEGTAVGEEGIILRTSDGGVSWEEQTSGTTNQMNDVYFADSQNGWIVENNGIILHTTNGGVSFVEEEQTSEVPTEYFLSQNYPNPFNSSSVIRYAVPKSSNIIIKVFDVLGNEIETLVNEEKTAGTYELTWNAVDLPSGVYFCQLKVVDFVETKKMILMK